MNERLNKRKQLIGEVLSIKMDKTVVLRVDRRISHPIYKKYVTKSKKYYAHDENNKCAVGDIVKIIESKPISKLKRWRVLEIQKKTIEV
tara:strand:- start:1615 stop:1881 length:267 start_codon:yes stop_codon:yes gene_type:complete